MWIIVTVCASGFAFLAMICSPCCWKYLKRPREVLCYLCHDKIKYGQWATHREKCLKDHSRFLDNLPTPCEVFCPQCGLKLRLWPVQDHAKFKCRAKNCIHHKQGREVNNDGSNRFNCFQHDYDLCGECVVKASESKLV